MECRVAEGFLRIYIAHDAENGKGKNVPKEFLRIYSTASISGGRVHLAEGIPKDLQ